MNLSKLLPGLAAISLCWACPWTATQLSAQATSLITQPGGPVASRVVSLPPPPVAGTSNSATSNISTPAHVPLNRPGAAAMNPHPNNLSGGSANLVTPHQFVAPPLPPLPPPPSMTLPQFPPASAVQPLQRSQPKISNSPSPTAPPTQNTALVAYGGAPRTDATPVTLPEEFPAGRLIAVVGTEHILAGDMAVFVEPIIDQNRSRISSPEEEKKIRSQLTRQALRQYCEIKAIYQEFFRDMVGTVPPKELAQTKEKVITRANKIFFDKQVPVLQEKYEAATISDLEMKLNEKSLSLMTLKGQFIEQVLASELERKYVPHRFEIDRQDLVDAYRADPDLNKWKVDGRARWRQVTVRFDKHATRQEAEAKIRALGDEMLLGGKAFEAVARQSSEGFTASEGGVYDWTTQGSLKSQPLDAALFSIPLNSLSQIIADDIGLHIIEVLEREAGHVKDFTEAQAEIRESLSEERRTKEVRAFRDRIMARTTIWTLWPEDIPGSRPLTAALGTDTN